MEDNMLAWLLEAFPKREASEIRFALDYVERFNHGTPGHLQLTVIARLALLSAQIVRELVAELAKQGRAYDDSVILRWLGLEEYSSKIDSD